MAIIYKEPSVNVYQFIETITPEQRLSDMPACIVGALYKEYGRLNVGFYGNVQQDYTIQLPTNGTLVSDSMAVEIEQSDGTLFEVEDTDYSITSTTLTIVAGLDKRGYVLLTYRAARDDYKDRFITASSPDELEKEWGSNDYDNFPITPDSPLLYGMKQALLASGGKTVYGINADEDYDSHVTALSVVLRNKDLYIIVPMTNYEWAHGLYKEHVETASNVDHKAERIAFTTWDFDLQPKLLTSPTGYVSAGSQDTFRDDEVNYVYEGVVSGDFLVYDGNNYSISLVSDNYIQLGGSPTLPVGTDYTYDIKTHVLNANEYSRYMRLNSGGAVSRRLVRMFPDEYETVLSDNELGYVKLYYAAAWMAGKHSNLAPSDSLTHDSLDFITDIRHSSNFFNEVELDNIAAGGNTILKQDNEFGPIYVRREITTDNSQLETAEVTTVMQADILAKALRIYLTPELGRKNKLSERDFKRVLNRINIVATSVINLLSNVKLKYIGPGTFVKYVMKDPDRADGVIVCISLDPYYALNNIDVLIYI